MPKLETTSIRFHYVPGTALLTNFHATLKYPKRKVQVVGVTKPKQTKSARQHSPACLSQAPSNFTPLYPEVHVQKFKKKKKKRRPDLSSPGADVLIPEVPRTTHSELEDQDLLQSRPGWYLPARCWHPALWKLSGEFPWSPFWSRRRTGPASRRGGRGRLTEATSNSLMIYLASLSPTPPLHDHFRRFPISSARPLYSRGQYPFRPAASLASLWCNFRFQARDT